MLCGYFFLRKWCAGTFFSGNDVSFWVPRMIVFAFSDNLPAENSKLSAEFKLQLLQLLECMEMMHGYFFSGNLWYIKASEMDHCNFSPIQRGRASLKSHAWIKMFYKIFVVNISLSLNLHPRSRRKYTCCSLPFWSFEILTLKIVEENPCKVQRALSASLLCVKTFFIPVPRHNSSFVFGSNLPWIRPHCTTQMSLDKIQI